MSPISKVDGTSVAGFLPEEHGEGETKAGDQRIARQRVTYLKNLYLRRRFVDLDLARHRIDDPDLPGPRVEVFLDLARHLVGRVALADHLDGQVGITSQASVLGTRLPMGQRSAETKARSGRRLTSGESSRRKSISWTTQPRWASATNGASQRIRLEARKTSNAPI